MLNVKFQILRLLNEEIRRLEKIQKQVYASRDYEKRKEYDENLKRCKNELAILRKDFDKLAEEAFLSDKEKELAYGYYCKGKEWETAFGAVLPLLTTEKLDLYEKNVKKQEQHMMRLKKSLIRKIQKYFNYYNKGESKKSKADKIVSSQDNQGEA